MQQAAIRRECAKGDASRFWVDASRDLLCIESAKVFVLPRFVLPIPHPLCYIPLCP
ncbi:MAG: hypothetical protein NTW21_43060 [Verrucomicrobia bacterium]|nr:hypothetical protein [Verrucomicrobiota bacterium]